MNPSPSALRSLGRFFAIALVAALLVPPAARAGVTLITHGLNGNIDGWVTGMADRIPARQPAPGTNYSCYRAYFYPSAGSYYLTAVRVAGAPPTTPESGEVIVKLDWSNLADGNSYNTYQVAAAAVPALLSTNFIPELAGHALAEFPLHLVGHSRGGSLVCEISRLLGTSGVWVDHLTTLDPHPLNNDGFTFDIFLYSAVDAPARTYANVLFHDNYWQNLELFTTGEPVDGAFVRQLHTLSGGYSSSHSDVHLWYHGTIDLNTPASDTEATLTAAERTAWWAPQETAGTSAGFHYSLIGGGDRLSADAPLGPGQPAIRDGYNQNWDLGAGLFPNRTPLTDNSGAWPNLIRFSRAETNSVVQGQTTPVRLIYQWAQSAASSATINFYLDDDTNPLNGNQAWLSRLAVAGTGADFVGSGTISLPLDATNASPGWHFILASITANGLTRYLYAPEPLQVLPPPSPPALALSSPLPGQLVLSVNAAPGQTIILQASPDLSTWLPLATNTLAADRWLFTNPPAATPAQFYRALLTP